MTLIHLIFSEPAIYDNVFDYCSTVTLFRLSRICRISRDAFQSYLQRTFNVDRLLSHYFDRPDTFRSLQARTDTVISGAAAADFFARSRWDPNLVLQICVPRDHLKDVGDWIQDSGYVFQPDRGHSGAFKLAIDEIGDEYEQMESHGQWVGGIAGVYTFVNSAARRGSNKSVEIRLVAALRSPIEVVLCSRCTSVMNFITHDTAYSVYPRATFESLVALVSPFHDGPFEDTQLYYTAGGGNLLVEPPGTAPSYPAFLEDLATREPSLLLGGRWIDDSSSWVLPLASSDLLADDQSHHPMTETHP
ncbi:hypothetical protein HETIRDRAFT_453507 [Heterobasidion irregulare TC 32-1]|uniref:Uncharacterized protein n=1 Tax=Heterobasidion irregulare (strain TC 32-1) TaxID=747525 RepID=W4K0W6_HETIT|nr:uncharacterized protein HETIRDRAFT_453507 [Heterobasidion irregulare TC 32-1]ETW78975.1 hypothetical protein HETIRDRAFT_453507 [Heterobasidion irregulare TC 32-1]